MNNEFKISWIFAWVFSFAVLCFCGLCAYVHCQDKHWTSSTDIPDDNRNEELLYLSMQFDKGLFFVTSYTLDGKIDKQILCSHVWENKELKEFICEEYETGDFYLFYYPVSVINVTFTTDSQTLKHEAARSLVAQ